MAYAVDTRVPIARTRSDIEGVLTRYGAKQYVSGWDEDQGIAMIGFTVMNEEDEPRQVRIKMVMPDPTAFSTDKKARTAWRSAWRSLLLVIKAKLEAVDSGISTVEHEFMADVVLPDGRTIQDWVGPQLSKAYKGGKMPKLLGI